MPFRGRSQRYTSVNAARNLTGSAYNTGRDYVSEQAGTRRHEFTSSNLVAPITLGDYTVIDLCRFTRSFTGADGAPTATASNNFQNVRVFNGSKVVDYKAKILLNNNSAASGFYIDIYSMALSFSDALYFDTVYTTECPVQFSQVANNEGDVTFKGVHVAGFTDNSFKNFKGVQRYMKQLGTVYISASDAGQSHAEFTVNGLPPNCRRSQTGMFYGLIAHFPASKNTAATGDYEIHSEISFKELPAIDRLPFRW